MWVWNNKHKIFKGGKNIYLYVNCWIMKFLCYEKKKKQCNIKIVGNLEKIKGNVYCLDCGEIMTKWWIASVSA